MRYGYFDNASREYHAYMTPENNYRRLMEIYDHAMERKGSAE